MALFMVLEDFAGDIGGPRQTQIVGAGTLLDSALYNIPNLLSIGCPLIPFVPATMSGPKAAFDKMSGGVAQINPDGNLLALLYAGGVSPPGGAVVGPPQAIYVQIGGNDLTGTRGNAALAFATIAAAFAVMQSGDEVIIGPGTFAAPGLVPALARGSIVGSGPQETNVVATPGNIGFDFSGVSRAAWSVKQMTVQNTGVGDLAIRADGNGAPAGTFFSEAITLQFVNIMDGSVFFRYCSTVVAFNFVMISGSGSTFLVETCNSVFFIGGCLLIAVDGDFDYEAADPLGPGEGGGQHRIAGAIWVDGSLLFKRQASLFVSPGAVVPKIDVLGLNGSPLGRTSQFQIYGQVSGKLTLDALADFPDIGGYDLSGATLLGGSEFAVQAPAANQAQIQGCAYYGNKCLVGDGVRWDGRSAQFRRAIIGSGPGNHALESTGTGVVIPPPFGVPPLLAVAPLTAFSFPFTMDVQYVVTVDANDPACLPLATSARSATGFDVQVTVATGDVAAAIMPLF